MKIKIRWGQVFAHVILLLLLCLMVYPLFMAVWCSFKSTAQFNLTKWYPTLPLNFENVFYAAKELDVYILNTIFVGGAGTLGMLAVSSLAAYAFARMKFYLKNALYAMVIGLCIYLLQIPVPQLIAQPLELMANMTTPLSMVITGMLLAAGDLGCIVRSKPVWKLAAVRMLLIPAVCLAVFGLLGFRSMTAQVVLLLECCPSAAITSVFAVQFGHDESFAAGSVVLTTLLSIVALPLCALVVTLL